MTAYNPPVPIRHAVHSLLQQSWRNLEIVIVDDHSDTTHAAEIAACELLDPRVRVVRLPANGGTYRARNVGVARSSGALVTFHDADDWSHPQKIERQARLLLGSDAAASTSDWVRASPSLEFQLFSGSGRLSYENLSSFMIRRPALEALGGFDEVRTGADTEMRQRVELVFGQPVARVEGPPLSIGLLHGASLTSESITPGWFSPDRIRYRAGWRHWHAAVADGTTDPRLVPGARPFAIPLSQHPDRASLPPSPAPSHVLLGDFRYDSPACRAAIARALAWTRKGLQVAFCQLATIRKGRIQREWLVDAVQALISSGTALRAGLGDPYTPALLLVSDPSVFDLPGFTRAGLRPDTLVVEASAWSFGAPADRAARVDRQILHLEQTFGRAARWLPGAGVTPAELRDLVGISAVIGREEAEALALRPVCDEGR